LESLNEYKDKVQAIANTALAMFHKELFGIFHGSISLKLDANKFIINTKEAIFDRLDEESMALLHMQKDYRWNGTSPDVEVHHGIYNNIHEAKCICYAMPPFTIAYSLDHDTLDPQDYFGKMNLPHFDIYDPKNFDDWDARAPFEIFRYMSENKTDIMIIKGYGVYAHARTLNWLAKKVALLENSCKISAYRNGQK